MAISLNNHETRIKALESRSAAPANLLVSGTASGSNLVGGSTVYLKSGTSFGDYSGGNYTLNPGKYMLEIGHHHYGNTEHNSSGWEIRWCKSDDTIVHNFGSFRVGNWGSSGTWMCHIFDVSVKTTYKINLVHVGGGGSITGRQHVLLTKLS